ncbi:hypothetical protein WOB53_18885 [Providencia rettgeri]|uniref:hypothetical protein n=1 Tax=Providencia rettgeri TaxID=587 RepID=UPI003D27A4A7
MRNNKFASFTGHFDPPFSIIPNVEVELIKTTAENSIPSDIRINIGVGKAYDFNVHIFNKKLGYIEIGEYEFSFSAKI